jgi:DNA polymerase III delta subunit
LISPKSKQLIKKDNPFAIANALGLRDRMNTWIILHDLLSHGESGEAVSGIMFWKIKTLLLENNFRKYSKEELEGMVLELPKIIHTGRREGEDLSVSLESFVLQYV